MMGKAMDIKHRSSEEARSLSQATSRSLTNRFLVEASVDLAGSDSALDELFTVYRGTKAATNPKIVKATEADFDAWKEADFPGPGKEGALTGKGITVRWQDRHRDDYQAVFKGTLKKGRIDNGTLTIGGAAFFLEVKVAGEIIKLEFPPKTRIKSSVWRHNIPNGGEAVLRKGPWVKWDSGLEVVDDNDWPDLQDPKKDLKKSPKKKTRKRSGKKGEPPFTKTKVTIEEVKAGDASVRRKDQGPVVGKIQQALKDLGFGDILGKAGPKKDGVDNKFGEDTEKAVKAFQKKVFADYSNLVNGVVGDLTWKKIELARKDGIDNAADTDVGEKAHSEEVDRRKGGVTVILYPKKFSVRFGEEIMIDVVDEVTQVRRMIRQVLLRERPNDVEVDVDLSKFKEFKISEPYPRKEGKPGSRQDNLEGYPLLAKLLRQVDKRGGKDKFGFSWKDIQKALTDKVFLLIDKRDAPLGDLTVEEKDACDYMKRTFHRLWNRSTVRQALISATSYEPDVAPALMTLATYAVVAEVPGSSVNLDYSRAAGRKPERVFSKIAAGGTTDPTGPTKATWSNRFQDPDEERRAGYLSNWASQNKGTGGALYRSRKVLGCLYGFIFNEIT